MPSKREFKKEERREKRRSGRDDKRGESDKKRSRPSGNDFDRNNRQSNGLSGQAFSESQLMDDLPKKKFTGRCRLFIGNLPNEVKEEELKELFSTHGEIAECYLSGKGFAFLRMDTRAHAESAKEAIDGRVLHGRQVRVRFAVHGASIRVKELSPTVSNEMLYHAFSNFGEIERAVHIVDEKGRPTGEGIVEFERKPNCNEAIAAIREKVFLLTASPKPLSIELLEPRDEDDGLTERMIPKTPALAKEREFGPRFPAPNTFEYIYGMKWKELYNVEKERRQQLENELLEARRRLEADMDLAYQDYQAQMLREDLQRRQQELERLEAARRERMQGMMNHNQGMMGQNRGMPGPISHPPAYPPMGSSNNGLPQFNNPSFGNMFNPGAHGIPPPLITSRSPQGVPPPGGGPSQQMQQPPRGGGNMIEGVQRLLNIFKSDNPPPNMMNRGDFGAPPGPPQGFKSSPIAPFDKKPRR